MKQFKFFSSILVFLMLLQFAAIAQSDFAPIGAVWYHNFHRGIYKTTVTNDTIIAGQKCNRLHQKVFIDSSKIWGPYENPLRDLYIYATEDTVFLYNEIFKRFTPLYVFNVKAGDTVRLPIIPISSCGKILSDTNEAKLAFVVDSVKDVLYDGELLKTVFSTELKSKKSYFGWSTMSDSTNIYTKKLGALKIGHIPNCKNNCAYLGMDGCPVSGNIRCYSDTGMSIKLSTDSCFKSSFIPASVTDFKNIVSTLNIYPNPASSHISIGEASFIFATKAEVFDAMGGLMMQQTFKANNTPNIDLQNWSSGVYYIRLLDDQNQLLGAAIFLKQ